MAKRYYWLKLPENFFDDDTISYIEEQENGVYYVNFYLKLCLKSVKTEGKLIRLIGENLIPYDVKSLSKLTNTPVDTVRIAMQLFEKIGLVKVLESGEIYLQQINELIGTETDKARIMREKRATERLNGNNVTELLPECYTEIEKDIEKEKELDLDLEKHTSLSSTDDDTKKIKINFNEIKEYFNTNCSVFPNIREMTDKRKKTITVFMKDHSEAELYQLFDMACRSSFLTGNNNNGWRADFDWIIAPKNRVKILEGVYENRQQQNIPKNLQGLYNFVQEEENNNGFETIF